MKTKEKLEQALREANAPEHMILLAKNGEYDDFESHSAFPIQDLVQDARNAGLTDIAQRAINGEFDGTKEEGDEWYEREGKGLLEKHKDAIPKPPENKQ